MPKCNEILGKFFSCRNDASHVIQIGSLTTDASPDSLDTRTSFKIILLFTVGLKTMASEPNGGYETPPLTFPSDDEGNIPELPSDDSVDDEIKQASVKHMLTSPRATGK